MSLDDLSRRNGSATATAVPPPRGSLPLQQLTDRLPRSPRQRRPGMVAAGVVLVGGFATVAAGLVARSDHTVAVLAVARPVAAGQVLTSGDVRVARIAGSGVSAMSAASLPTTVGETATSSLSPGMLLAPSMLAATPVPAPGMQVVAVAEKSSLVPGGVAAGRDVSLVQVAGGSAQGGSGSGVGSVLVARATVVGVRADATGSTVVLSVEVAPAVAPGVANSAAAGTLAVTLLPVTP